MAGAPGVSDAATLELARAAGLAVEWTDYQNRQRTVSIDVLRGVLGALGLPATTDAQCRDSMAELAHRERARRLITAQVDQPVGLPGRPGAWRISLEDGTIREGVGAQPTALPVGYHQVEAQDWSGTLAVAPRRGWTLEDAGSGRRLAGLAAQLYALSRRDDGRCGDFTALAKLGTARPRAGIDAVAISPVHALFTADPGRAAPYAPSSRVALNPGYSSLRHGRAGGRGANRLARGRHGASRHTPTRFLPRCRQPGLRRLPPAQRAGAALPRLIREDCGRRDRQGRCA